jgi:hypothetical protein
LNQITTQKNKTGKRTRTVIRIDCSNKDATKISKTLKVVGKKIKTFNEEEVTMLLLAEVTKQKGGGKK